MARLARAILLLGVPGVVFGLSKFHAASIADLPYDFTASARLGWAISYVLLLWLAAYAVGLPTLATTPRLAVTSSVVTVGIAALGISAIQLLLGDALLPRMVVLGSAMLLVPWFIGTTLVYQRAQQRAAERDRVFLVGERAEAAHLEDDLGANPEKPAVLVGSVTVDDLAADEAPALHDLVHEHGATLLVLDARAQAHADIVAEAAEVHEEGVRIRTLSLFYEDWLGKLPLSELARVSLLFDVGELHRARYARVKRLVDLTAGLLGLLVLVVVTPFVLVGNLIGNRGPLIFRQERVGKGGEPFTILKFRTMRPGSSDGTWTTEDDPRVTGFGRLLRRTHVDELPQLVNILRGDLSLVGPRPEQPRYVEELSEKLPFYRLRHLVRPGLTGWAQVKYGYAGDERDALEKLQYEFFYLRRQGVAFDMRIVARTVRSVLGSEGGGR